MKVQTIYDILNEISPFENQEEWDNSGLNVGDFGQEVKKIYLSLDIDDEVIENMDENSLLITHHPVIFKGIKNLVPYNFSTKYSIKLIQKNCSLIAMHTNFDKTHLNRYVAEKILGLEGNQEDFVFYADVETTFEDFARKIKEKLQISNLKVVKAKENIKRVAVTTGAGMSLLDYINADCFLTGDIKYHEAMDALSRGVSLIDIGHFESEKYFTDVLFPVISELIEEMEIVKLNSKNPFSYI